MRAPLLVSVLLVAVAGGAGCVDTDPNDCNNDGDCGPGRVCSAGECVECASNANCTGNDNGASFCCQGFCRPESEIDQRCGCSPAPSGPGGQNCSAADPNAFCLAGEVTASVDTVDEGTCGCGCTPAQGGPICGEPAEPGGAPVCSCVDNEDCRGASLDDGGRPHRSADTCVPGDLCVCFTLGTADVCDPDSATPDCSTDQAAPGCLSLDDDVNNCGSPGTVCADAGGSPAQCVDGGCLCDALGDCAGGNVDSCEFVVDGEPSRCVCDDFTSNGLQVACPMELECEAGGCRLDGVVYATQEDLRSALGLP